MVDENAYKKLPHPEVRAFLSAKISGSKSLAKLPSNKADIRVCELLEIPLRKGITSDLRVAVKSIPKNWWWHMSHLEVVLTPTTPDPDIPVTNSVAYDKKGFPVSFRAMCWTRKDLPRSLCIAFLMAKYDLPAVYLVNASATEEALK